MLGGGVGSVPAPRDQPIDTIQSSITSELALDALLMATKRRKSAGDVVVHSYIKVANTPATNRNRS